MMRIAETDLVVLRAALPRAPTGRTEWASPPSMPKGMDKTARSATQYRYKLLGLFEVLIEHLAHLYVKPFYMAHTGHLMIRVTVTSSGT